ncbi:response regulator [Pelosinus sp. UFO1]|uniref:response regulator n=2 Tax=unclassified Pelosinus TaxID=2629460 RepID=UPI0015646247|nr:response regulator [Pelosinus sp. UFO1]
MYMKVLIVDDAVFIRLTLKMMLEKNGYQVVGEAANGAEAILKYNELKPDLVTMDITMPQMDGITALKAIKKMDSSAKVVMISAMGQEATVKDAIVSGANGFIVKPFVEEQVIRGLSKFK